MKFLNTILSAFVLASASAALEDTKVEKEFNKVDIEAAFANDLFFKRGLSLADLDSNVKRNLEGYIYSVESAKSTIECLETEYRQYTTLSQYAGMKYDVQLIPIEASCKSMGLDGYGCEDNDYGSNQVHSGIVLMPVVKGEDDEYSIINARKLSPWFQFPGTSLTQQDALIVATQPGSSLFTYALMAASNGYVAFIPLKTGYGTSSNLVSADIIKKTIVTSSLPLYARVKKYIEEQSNGMTTLDNKAVYTGSSSGGFAAVAAADGFEKHGIKPVQVLASSVPARLESWALMGFVRSILHGTYSFSAPYIAAVNTIAFSEIYGANVMNSDLIAPYKSIFQGDNTPSIYLLENPGDWFTNAGNIHGANLANFGRVASFSLPGTPAPSNFDPEVYLHMKAALDNGISDPCGKTGKAYDTYTENVEKVCMAAIENSLTKIIEKAKYPIDICMMENDPTVAFENGVEPKNGKLVTIQDQGSHGNGIGVCSYNLFAGFKMNPKGTKAPKAMKGSKTPKSMKGTKAPKSLRGPKSPKATKSPKGNI